MTETPSNTNQESRFDKRYNVFNIYGYVTCLFFLLLIISAATLIKISGAVTSAGRVVQSGENKSVQHPTGGPVGEILVRNGDQIKKGDPIIVLDSASIEAQYKLLQQREFELKASLDRLFAVVNNEPTFRIDREKYSQEMALYPDIVSTQESLFIAQGELFDVSRTQIESRIRGLAAEQSALTQQISTNRQQLDFLNESITEIDDLFKRELVSKSRLTALQRDRVSVLTQIEALKVSKTRADNAYSDAQFSLESLQKEQTDGIWREIEAIKTQLVETQRNRDTVNDQQTRLVINSPADGRVHEMSINNVDAVIQAGETILQIVPFAEGSTINARVAPIDIEQVYTGQEVRVRFDSFDARKTPEVKGSVLVISPDSSTDRDTGEIYFLVTVSLPDTELEKITTGDVIPGLPVSTMFTTNERTLLNYLLKPLSAQLFSAFREG